MLGAPDLPLGTGSESARESLHDGEDHVPENLVGVVTRRSNEVIGNMVSTPNVVESLSRSNAAASEGWVKGGEHGDLGEGALFEAVTECKLLSSVEFDDAINKTKVGASRALTRAHLHHAPDRPRKPSTMPTP